jgi:hypothetical protein
MKEDIGGARFDLKGTAADGAADDVEEPGGRCNVPILLNEHLTLTLNAWPICVGCASGVPNLT